MTTNKGNIFLNSKISIIFCHNCRSDCALYLEKRLQQVDEIDAWDIDDIIADIDDLSDNHSAQHKNITFNEPLHTQQQAAVDASPEAVAPTLDTSRVQSKRVRKTNLFSILVKRQDTNKPATEDPEKLISDEDVDFYFYRFPPFKAT